VAQAVTRGHPVLFKGRTAPGMFALLATRYFEEHGADEGALAAVAVKNHGHGFAQPHGALPEGDHAGAAPPRAEGRRASG